VEAHLFELIIYSQRNEMHPKDVSEKVVQL